MESGFSGSKDVLDNCWRKSDFLTYAAIHREELEYEELVKSIRNISQSDFDRQSVMELVKSHKKASKLSAYEQLLLERGELEDYG